MNFNKNNVLVNKALVEEFLFRKIHFGFVCKKRHVDILELMTLQ